MTSGRVGLGLKMYLRVIEMVESEEGQGGGVARRAWFGVKLVSISKFRVSGSWDWFRCVWPGRDGGLQCPGGITRVGAGR